MGANYSTNPKMATQINIDQLKTTETQSEKNARLIHKPANCSIVVNMCSRHILAVDPK